MQTIPEVQGSYRMSDARMARSSLQQKPPIEVVAVWRAARSGFLGMPKLFQNRQVDAFRPDSLLQPT